MQIQSLFEHYHIFTETIVETPANFIELRKVAKKLLRKTFAHIAQSLILTLIMCTHTYLQTHTYIDFLNESMLYGILLIESTVHLYFC